ncbi:hypothetical protein AC1031_002054 [Aphanomyces cochlioides]|nr:hypothetical protein AC1031_002054 [Aphanomyces cochlioides]
MPKSPQVVCVTGGSGFLGSCCIKLLLERGYRVHTTVRDPANAAKVNHLKGLPGADDRLTFFQADLLTEGSFDGAIQGCSVVLHTASPFFMKNQSREGLVHPAVQGTLNVLRSVARTPGVRRVVLTSSSASVYVHCGTNLPTMSSQKRTGAMKNSWRRTRIGITSARHWQSVKLGNSSTACLNLISTWSRCADDGPWAHAPT